jgi:hypothetical protein
MEFADPNVAMKEMITFIYLFEGEPELLWDDAIFNIIDEGLVYRGNDWGRHMRFKIWSQGTFVTQIPSACENADLSC